MQFVATTIWIVEKHDYDTLQNILKELDDGPKKLHHFSLQWLYAKIMKKWFRVDIVYILGNLQLDDGRPPNMVCVTALPCKNLITIFPKFLTFATINTYCKEIYLTFNLS